MSEITDDLRPTYFTRRQTILILFLLILLVIVSFIFGYFFRQYITEKNGDFSLVYQAMQIIKEHAYKDLPDNTTIEYGMIRGMIQTLQDPFTTFINPPEAELQTDQLNGKFGGIGVRIEKDAANQYRIFPLPTSTASQAGLREGDRLIAIENLSINPITDINAIQAAIRGPIGSIVKIVVIHPESASETTLSIKRAEVVIPSVTSNLDTSDPSIGIIHLSIIADSSPDEVLKAAKDLKSRGATAVILDLRNNGGGLVDAGVNLAKLFLTNNQDIISEQFRGEEPRNFSSSTTGPLSDLPLVILVNQNTASAAEILAGTLQHNHRAQIIGNKTYGKDAVQLVFTLSDGSSLHVTSGIWWIPGQKGKLSGKGLQPDVIISEQEISTSSAIEIAKKALGH